MIACRWVEVDRVYCCDALEFLRSLPDKFMNLNLNFTSKSGSKFISYVACQLILMRSLWHGLVIGRTGRRYRVLILREEA